MTLQLPIDCLIEILEYLEEDQNSLRSCLLVNRFWCKVAVKILWKNVWNLQYNNLPNRKHVPLSILSTLISCLPNDSRYLLYVNGINIPTPTPKSPLFNYISFIKVLLFYKIEFMIKIGLNHQQINSSQSLNLVLQELLNAFMNQIPSLKILDYDLRYRTTVQNIPFVAFPGAKGCLTDLSELKCDSNLFPERFHHLSQICHKIQSLSIIFGKNVSNG